MGIYDRDYEREPQPWQDSYGSQGGFQLRMPRSMVNRIVLVTVLAHLAQVLFFPRVMGELLALYPDWYQRPWQIYQLLTYALVHSEATVFHVAANMFTLWMFGRELENRLGGKELLLFYLGAVLAGGLMVTAVALGTRDLAPTIGASAGSVAAVVLFALLYPHRKVLLYFAIPVPMWAVGAMVVGFDLMRAMGAGESNVSWQGHLGGALFAFLYHTQGWRLARWLPSGGAMPSLSRKPRLRVHREDDDEASTDQQAAEVDRILAKISASGADSLSAKEKRTLERASREAQSRRRR